ncbi:NAD(P)-dependent dehydrogenase, short-chain alcohol dehydrogenase family [Afipia sp. GAS231]|nr:NAD(P)-dependent dehydrogenase, short-chain alcohol dehydrogenase family [Afipia sp. GAS231]
MSSSFHGKVALVTGGTSGIGRETAVAFAARGAKVVVAGRREDEGFKTVDLIRSGGGEAHFVKADVSQPDQVAALLAEVVGRYGGLDMAFNNAGIEGTPFIPLENYAEETWDQVIGINLKGLFLSMKHELPHLVKNRGAMVNMASVAGLTGGRLGAAYYASKHGVVGITRSAAIEYADKGVRINAVAPGVISTDMATRAFFQDPAVTARIKSLHPMGRLGMPGEVANAVLWLCSGDSSFTTGHVLSVDGGFVVP